MLSPAGLPLHDRDRHTTWVQFLVVVAVGVITYLWGENQTIRHGFGWDGLWYGTWAQDFHRSVIVEGITPYEVQRVLPSGIIHGLLRLFGVSLEPDVTLDMWNERFLLSWNVREAFRAYHLALWPLIAWLWLRIMAVLQLRTPTRWLGFIAFFCNYHMLKQYFYDPVQTDPTALALALALLLAWLQRNAVGVLIVTILGAFCWPLLIYFGSLLFLLPRGLGSLSSAPGRVATYTAAGLAALTLVAQTLVYLLTDVDDGTLLGMPLVFRPLVPLSIALTAAYVFAGARAMLRRAAPLDIVHAVLQMKVPWVRILLVGAVLIAAKALVGALGTVEPATPGTTLPLYMRQVLRLALVRPLDFIVAHVVYFGPFVWLVYFHWSRIATVVAREGLGLVLFMLLQIPLSVNSESRHLLAGMPFLFAWTLVAVDDHTWSRRSLWLFGLASLAVSKFWFPHALGQEEGDLLAFPMQNYFMNFGPWMSHEMYLLQGTLVVAAALLVDWWSRQSGPGRESLGR